MAIEICMASDDNYAVHMGICIVSIMENNNSNVNIHILNNNISDDNINRLHQLKDKYPNLDYFFYDINEYFSKNDYAQIISNELNDNGFFNLLGISSYSRLFLTDILPDNIDKILYLDADTIVVDGLDDLFSTDISDYYCAGVINMNGRVTKSHYTGKHYATPFINSGVLLINIDKWRKTDFIESAIDLIKDYPDKGYLHDQNIINILSKGEVLLLDPKFNAMSEFYYVKWERYLKLNSYFGSIEEFYSPGQMKNALANPTIVHFLSQMWDRPWIKKNNLIPHRVKNPFNEEYYHYKELSPWKDEPFIISDLTFKKKLYYEMVRIVMRYFPVKIIARLYKR